MQLPKIRVSGQLRQRINQTAHQLAILYEMRLKAIWSEQIEQAISKGMPYSDLELLLEKITEDSRQS